MSKLNRALAWNPLGSAASMDVLWFDALKVVAQSPRPLWNRHLVTNCFHHFHFHIPFVSILIPGRIPGSTTWLIRAGCGSLGGFVHSSASEGGFLQSLQYNILQQSTTIYNLQSTTHEQFFNVLHTIKVWVSSKDCPKQPHTGVELCAKRDTMWNHVRPFDMKRRWKLWNRFEHFEMQHLDTFVILCNPLYILYIDLCIHVVDLRHFSARCYEVLAELFLDGRGMHYDGTCDMTWQLGPTRPGD